MKQCIPTRQSTLVAQLRLRLLLAIGLLLAVIIGSLTLNNIVANNQQRLSQQTVLIHDDVNGILRSMLDQETGLRGYIATDVLTFLEPFAQGRPQYLSIVRELHVRISDSQFRATRSALARVEAQASTWYTSFALLQIGELQAGNVTAPRSLVRRLQGKALFDRFRVLFATLQAQSDQDLTSLQAQIATTNRLTFWSAGALALLVSLFLWWTFSHFARDLSRQLASLQQFALQFRGGHLAARIDNLQHADLQQVAQTFNTLAAAVQQKQVLLQAALYDAETNYVQLERTKSQLRAIIDASQEAMLFLTPDGRPIRVNTRFTKFFGLDVTTVLAQSPGQLQALLKEQFVDSASSTWSTTDQEHIFREQQVQVLPERRELDLFSLPVTNVDAAYIGRLYVWHDVTHEHEVDRMKSEFISLASHELRTPLTSIKGYVDLLLTDDSVGELGELQREFLEIVQNNTRRLMRLVNDLLDLSRIESGKIELQREALDLNLLIQELLPSFQPGWDARLQTFTLSLPQEAPIVLADPDRVMQILSNLLSNAHKYAPEEGHIALSVELVGSAARIAITNSGMGLSAEEQAQLFTRFYRVQNAATQAAAGTGLGLVITRSLVEMQGGEIQVSSEPGHNTTFRFTLPLAPGQEGGRAQASGAPTRHATTSAGHTESDFV